MSDKKHYEAIKDVHVNLENRNHAIDEYGYGPLNPSEKNDDFWNEKAKLWKTSVEEAKKSRCGNCAAFNRTPKILKAMGDALGPVGDKIVEKANLGYCEFFYFKCAGERTCDAWVVNGPLKEDAPANAAGSGEIAGLGVGPQGEPGVSVSKQRKHQKENEKGEEKRELELNLFRRNAVVAEESEKMKTLEGEPVKAFVVEKGKFAGHDTFIVPTDIFHNARNEKKKGKHWTKYIGNDEYGKAIRQHARMNFKKPIILQDERTGALCYARYGAEKSLMEAPLLSYIGKKGKLNPETGKSLTPKRRTQDTKIAKADDEHDIYHRKHPNGADSYHVVNRETGKVVSTIYGNRTRNKTFHIDTTDSTGTGPKAHEVYHKILKSGHSTSLVGHSHSEGGQKIWQRLSSRRGVSVHGWHRGKPVNLDPKDPQDTHAYADENDPTSNQVRATKLVASLHKRKTVKK